MDEATNNGFLSLSATSESSCGCPDACVYPSRSSTLTRPANEEAATVSSTVDKSRQAGTATGADSWAMGSSKKMIDRWTWGKEPGSSSLVPEQSVGYRGYVIAQIFLDNRDLRHCLTLLCAEQRRLCADASRTTLFSGRLRRRLLALKRRMLAERMAHRLVRNQSPEKSQEVKDSVDNEAMKRNIDPILTMSPSDRATHGLAKIGSRAALSFAFSFLRRAWRSGSDIDLCSDLLQDTVNALWTLPPASLFDANVSPVWMEVVERTTKFLRGVVKQDELLEAEGTVVPVEDRHRALAILLEFAIQKG